MNILKVVSIASLSVFSTLASASLVVTNNGFVDTSDNLEWLAPGKVTSLSDYNAYTSDGWRVATISDLTQLTANFFTYNLHYSAFDQSVFDGFKTIANSTSDSFCAGTFFCSVGWYHNMTTNGPDIKYEYGAIGLFSNPAQTNPNIVQQNQLNMTSAFINTTLGSYDLYGYSSANYSTFMVKAVPLPETMWLFGSGLIGLVSAFQRRKAK